jgi:hypothetical protein
MLGWNYYAQTKHDLVEAKKHVDLALATSPDDTKVLEDAGRVKGGCTRPPVLQPDGRPARLTLQEINALPLTVENRLHRHLTLESEHGSIRY